MAAYIALQRVEPGPVRTLAWVGRAPSTDAPVPPPLAATARRAVDDRPLEERLRERWSIIRDAWAITTFFLFDPESWR